MLKPMLTTLLVLNFLSVAQPSLALAAKECRHVYSEMSTVFRAGEQVLTTGRDLVRIINILKDGYGNVTKLEIKYGSGLQTWTTPDRLLTQIEQIQNFKKNDDVAFQFTRHSRRSEYSVFVAGHLEAIFQDGTVLVRSNEGELHMSQARHLLTRIQPGQDINGFVEGMPIARINEYRGRRGTHTIVFNGWITALYTDGTVTARDAEGTIIVDKVSHLHQR